MKYNISSQSQEEEGGVLLLRELPAGSSVILHTGQQCKYVWSGFFFKEFQVERVTKVFTWTYAEASDDPNNTADTDVAHEGHLRL